MCRACGSLLSPVAEGGTSLATPSRHITCRACDSVKDVALVALPYVFRYLVAELYAMNIKVAINVK